MTEPVLVRTLSNGLVLVAEPMDWLESAAFTLAVPVGSAFDPPGRSGLSRFTCEMVLRGAGPRDSRRIIEDLDTLGVDWNDSVSEAHTFLSGATLAAHLPAALAIFADVVQRPHLPDDQLEPARQVLLQALRAVEDEPAQKLMRRLHQRHYPDPWGRPVEGQEEAILATTREDIEAQFRRHYRPNGTILGVAGRFDWARLVETVEAVLGDWPEAAEPHLAEQPSATRYEYVPHDSHQTHIGIAYPSVPYRHPDYFQAWGAMGVLSSGMSSRLFTEVRKRRGLCYSVYAVYHSLHDRGGVFCYAGTTADRAQETLDVTLAELVRLRQGIQPEEIQRLKARIKSALIMQQESSLSRSWAVVRDWYHLGRVRPLEELHRLVDELTSASINAYLAEHPPGEFTIVTLGPRPLEVPGGIP